MHNGEEETMKYAPSPENYTIAELVKFGYVHKAVAKNYKKEFGKPYAWIVKHGHVQSGGLDYYGYVMNLVLANWDKGFAELQRVGMKDSGGKFDPNKLLLDIMEAVQIEIQNRQDEIDEEKWHREYDEHLEEEGERNAY
jgi:hypothetical protein